MLLLATGVKCINALRSYIHFCKRTGIACPLFLLALVSASIFIVPAVALADSGVVRICAENLISYAIAPTGEIYQWGDRGNCSNEIPDRVGTARNWTAIAVYNVPTPLDAPAIRGSNLLAINSSGQLFEWEYSDNWVGLGAPTMWSKPPRRIGSASNWRSISGSQTHVLAINSAGQLYAWGDNTCGQLGDGTKSARQAPVRVGAGISRMQVSAGDYFSVGIDTDGIMYKWGTNYGRQSDDDGDYLILTPEPVFSLWNFDDYLDDGNEEDFIDDWVDDDPFDYWGEDDPADDWDDEDFTDDWEFEDPDDDFFDIYYLDTWIAVSAGVDFAAAINTEGKLYTWGTNTDGQLGNGDLDNLGYATPTEIGEWDTWKAVGAGQCGAAAINTKGQLFEWGRKDEVWDTYKIALKPERLGSSSNWVSVSKGRNHGLVSSSSGQLYSWGNNGCGQLGDGSRKSRLTPVAVRPLTPVVWVSSFKLSTQYSDYVYVGSRSKINARILPANASSKQITWISWNKNVATVDSQGWVTALKPGKASIEANIEGFGGCGQEMVVKVQPAPRGIKSSIRKLNMRQGSSFVVPMVVDGTSKTVENIEWRSSNRRVATLETSFSGQLNAAHNKNTNLTITAGKPGKAKITLKTRNNKSITYEIKVSKGSRRGVRATIGSLPRKGTMKIGTTRNLKARLLPANATHSGRLSWISSRPSVASINQAGVLRAKRKGQTTITLKVGNITQSAKVTVK